MPKPETLVLFTETYPSGKGENFLDAEITFLASAFDRVLIVPGYESVGSRSLPAGVEVASALADADRRGWKHVSGQIWSCLVEPEFYRELARGPQGYTRLHDMRAPVGRLAAGRRVVRWMQANVGRTVSLDNTLFYSYWLDGAAVGLSLFAKRHPCYFVARAHGFDLYPEQSPSGNIPYRNLVLSAVSRIYCVSDHGRRYLAGAFPHVAPKIHVSRLGVTDPGHTTRPSDDGTLRIVSCSFLSPVKRLPLLIEGLRVLGERLPSRQFSWDHLGGGPDLIRFDDLSHRRLPANVNATWHGDLTSRQVAEFYSRSPIDGFVSVSASEGVPVSMMEACSFGIPIVATAVGGVPEIVNQENGVLLDSTPSPHQVADGLQVLMVGDTAEHKRSASKATWRTRFDAATNYSRFVEELKEGFHAALGETLDDRSMVG